MPIDLTVALAHVDGDLQLLAELAAMFLQDYPRLLEEAHESIGRGDHSEFERTVHTLKGRLAFFGIEKARDQALKLEMMGRKHDLTGVGPALADLEAEVEGIIPEFDSLAREQGK